MLPTKLIPSLRKGARSFNNYEIIRFLRSSSVNERVPRITASPQQQKIYQPQIDQPKIPSSTTAPFPSLPPPHNELEIDWKQEMLEIKRQESRSVFQPPLNRDDELLAAPPPLLRPTHNLAAYVNKSVTLQRLIELGVDLHRIERRKGLAEFVLRLDFQRDVRQHLQFLNDVGVAASELGPFITKNPLIFRESIDDLQTRFNYLQSKRFQADEIQRIVVKNPFWLMFRTQRIDARLGYFQKSFDLLGNEIRALSVRQPKVITYNLEAIRQCSFTVREEFGFNADESKALLLAAPKIWMMSTFTYCI